MLLESLVKATVELQGFRVVTVTGDAGGLVAELAPDRRFVPRCGQCGTRGAYRDTRPVRRFRHVPLWGIPVALRYAPRRVGCPRCAGVHVESMPWVRGKQQMTHALLVTLATWARALPWEQVARLFRCSWGTVATAVEEAVAVGLAHRDLDHLTHIGIDEISRKRGHVYVTNVYDLARKRLVWSGEGRTTDTLNAFFDFLGPEKTAALAGICCDMWHPYIDVIKDRAGQAVLVFDKFHIVSHLMKAVDQVRRDEIREKGPAHKALMHKTRFIWLKNPWNLTEAQHRRLSELEHLNLKINRAYLLKELFAHFWTYRRAGWAKRYLKRWFWWATHSRLPPLRDFAWMLRRHEKDILNYFRMPIDKGMSRPLLEFCGGSGEILRDLLHLRSVSEAEALISGAEIRDQLRHICMSLQAPEPLGRFEDAGGDPTQHHLAAPPALHVAFDVAGPADEALDGVGRGQRALETRREAKRQHGHRLLEPFAHTGRRAGMLLVETAGEVSQQPRRGLDVLTLIGALEGRQYPGPLTLRQMVEDVAGLVDLAALHQRGTTEHRRDRRP